MQLGAALSKTASAFGEIHLLGLTGFQAAAVALPCFAPSHVHHPSCLALAPHHTRAHIMMRADNADDALGTSSAPPHIEQFLAHTNRLQQRYQSLLDSTTPYPLHRWGATAALLVLFMLRIVLSQGWYIVCYALFIYLLNLFLAFLTPKFDPSYDQDLAEQDVEEGEPGLPTSNSKSGAAGGLMSGVFGSSINNHSGDDEFRPFIRRLPEFKFWLSATQAVVISLFATTSSAFDIPVFWPILLMYFCILFTITMRRQIKHMIRHKYVPFDLGRKTVYGRK